MARKIILIPIGINKNLTSLILSLSNILNKDKIDFNFYSPLLCNKKSTEYFQSTYFYFKKEYKSINCIKPVFIKNIEYLFDHEIYLKYLEKILDSYYLHNNKKLVLIEGISYLNNISMYFCNQLNLDIARILNAEIIFVVTIENTLFQELSYKMYILENFFLNKSDLKVLGIIFNNYFNQFNIENNTFKMNKTNQLILDKDYLVTKKFFQYNKLPILAFNSMYKSSFFINTKSLLSLFHAKIIFLNKTDNFKINFIIFVLNHDLNFLHNLNKSTLLIVDLKIFFSLEKILFFIKKNRIYFSILIIINNKKDYIKSFLYQKLIKIGISIFSSKEDLYSILFNLNKINLIQNNFVKKNMLCNNSFSIISNQIYSILKQKSLVQDNISSYKFLYKLKKLSNKLQKSIILPEGENKKIIQAAYLCHKLNLCKCILLGNPEIIHKKFNSLGLKLSNSFKIYNPKTIILKYIKIFFKFNKNISLNECKKILQKNNIILSMLLLMENSKYHGVVAGIINTTADVIRPALKLVKMKKDTNLISSIFFMLFLDKVLVYGDCAINPNPSALDLSEIAIQSADSAKNFGINPRIAMLSYSTNDSGSGSMVEKVRIATNLVRKKRPDLLIEGPIQYDAANDIFVSNIKCPQSQLLGNANVFIFPDLNSGNIAYKAVQRSCSIISIGPIIQGLKKPVNDLSRGSSIKDILYTIVITAIQSNII
ncbi:Phosphate acetyltransferase [Buchnera aphidicola (Chaitophorus sp. 3695)]|uniref:phosphate acetyltransferase n=1 Tax=Buchnera aphidicola TaxID=9 RepID=UPI0034648DEA